MPSVAGELEIKQYKFERPKDGVYVFIDFCRNDQNVNEFQCSIALAPDMLEMISKDKDSVSFRLADEIIKGIRIAVSGSKL
jgi:ribosomal protein S6